MKIYIFGDSIAAGQESSFSWVDLLRNKLKNDEIINNSVGGSTTLDVLERFSENDADLIIFAVGLNDSSYFEKEKRILLVDFKKNIGRLIKL
ncbi:SGNH/GDSL hydrolase family protein, partial [Candidatus Woesearchaeota archaeon]|nr:SGNH/GDSL hydrolase family protein [Candidatus Woesearchaeota archaeon]